MKNNKGFTLIELIVVLGLSGIVISIVISFFIANYKSYETINTESEVQYQSQFIINYITNKILEARSFDEADNKFEYSDGKTASFELYEPEEKVKYTFDLEQPVYVGNYVKDLKIKPYGENNNEVEITLILEKGNNDIYSAKQIVYMRNSTNW